MIKPGTTAYLIGDGNPACLAITRVAVQGAARSNGKALVGRYKVRLPTGAFAILRSIQLLSLDEAQKRAKAWWERQKEQATESR